MQVAAWWCTLCSWLRQNDTGDADGQTGGQVAIDTIPDFIPKLTESTAMKRSGSSERDVGRTVVFLSSTDADYITGQTVNVDGGIWIVP